MATNPNHLNPRGVASKLAAAALLSFVLGGASASIAAASAHKPACHCNQVSPSGASSYGWPLRPFHAQHPVRGFFGDPRIGLAKDHSVIRSFHFGIDIAGADGTPVYATLTGRVRGGSAHHDVVAITGPRGRVFAYWHVVPVVRSGQRVIAYRTLIGHIAPSWGHVHFAEFRLGIPLNPLRPGALGPYSDTTPPLITGLGVPEHGLAVEPAAPVSRHAQLVVEVHDTPELKVGGAWSDLTAAPALVQWRVDSGGWTVALDFRRVVPKPDAYDGIYAYHTHQNRPHHRGHYLIYLTPDWDPGELASGRHVLEVVVVDIRGNHASASIAITTAD